MQVSANIPGELPGESQAVQVLAGVQVQVARGESPAVQVSAKAPGWLPGESPAVQVLANVPGERAGKVRRCTVWPASPESGRGKSGGAGFG